MRKILSIFLVTLPLLSVAQFAPPAGQEGTTAMHADSSAFVAWATGCVVERGPMRIDKPEQGLASYGVDADGIGFPDGQGLVSLGDGGNAVVTFASPICNGPGPDFAVFENPLENAQQPGFFFLELGFVEVSSDGVNYFRFPAVSLVPETPQVGGFGCVEPHLVHNLAGKYAPMYGTPFDLDELEDDPALDKDNITHVRIVDVVGNIDPEFATYDSQGHVVNDPWPTPFPSSGFDLDAVGVIHDRAHASVDNHDATSVTLYPNPVQNTLMVKAHEVSSITVYSLTGQCVAESPSNQVDVASLQPGVYFARVVADGTVIVNKFVKK
ncbi:MAG: T9SS type A sorting domain-containing protein [Bacteroidales bacterium]|nr:T9SS type A sorting domain-containing protein [Bacteroidales bacterium]